jgi:microsomal dipeptidase-like Zn-dependent dipeptidase
MDQHAEGATTMNASILRRDFLAGAAKGALFPVALRSASAFDAQPSRQTTPRERRARKHMVQAGSAAEIREAQKQGKMAVVWSVNGPPIVGQLEDRDDEIAKMLSGNFLRVLDANRPLREVRA